MLNRILVAVAIGIVVGAIGGYVGAMMGYPGWAVGAGVGLLVPIVYLTLMGKPAK